MKSVIKRSRFLLFADDLKIFKDNKYDDDVLALQEDVDNLVQVQLILLN